MIRLALRLLLFLSVGTAFSASAQEGPADFTKLSLEELLEIDVIPIDVLGSHIHLQGDWMVGYKLMYMDMGEHGGHVSHDDFMVIPMGMSMQMHMLHLMYGVTDRLTLVTMIPFNRNTMEGHSHLGTAFTTSSEGVGDVEIGAHYALFVRGADYLLGELAFSLPTGAIDVRDDTPSGDDQKLPYPMRMGSGTVDLVGGLTYIDQVANWAWGTHGSFELSLGRNRFSYRVGNRYRGGLWLTRRITDWFAPLIQVDAYRLENLDGADPELNPRMTPAADPIRQEETRVELQPGLSLYVPSGPLRGQRLALTAPIPIYIDRADGAAHRSRQISLTWQWTF